MDIIIGNTSYKNVSPVMTGTSSPEPYVTDCSIDYNQPFWKCLDGQLSSYFRTSILTVCPFTASLDYGEGNEIVVNAYQLDCSYNAAWTMKDWQFEGSNDNATWDVLDSQTNISWAANNVQSFFISGNTKPYRYYRLNVLAKNGNNSVCINELYLLQEKPALLEFRKIKKSNLPTRKTDGSDAIYITDTGELYITDREGNLKPIGGTLQESVVDVEATDAEVDRCFD